MKNSAYSSAEPDLLRKPPRSSTAVPGSTFPKTAEHSSISESRPDSLKQGTRSFSSTKFSVFLCSFKVWTQIYGILILQWIQPVDKEHLMEHFDLNMQIPVRGQYDVIVAGGGVAGAAAALSAARCGKKVLLTEKSTMLGGLATMGLINYFEPLC
ncbi:MAG: FAD-dependent oxidoreductase, partial [Clostridia bacterium]|nr:FAD-dependent oxidoreductase [Clostridia bacterium]